MSRQKLYQIGGIAALILAALLFVPIFFIAADAQTSSLFQNNFLVFIFKLHAGFSGVQEWVLDGLNFPDITIIVLFSIVTLTLFPALKQEQNLGNRSHVLALCRANALPDNTRDRAQWCPCFWFDHLPHHASG